MENFWSVIHAARIVYHFGKPAQVSHADPLFCELVRKCLFLFLIGMFGLGQSQTRCIKGYSTAPIPDVTRLNPMRLAKLIWINNRTVTLMLADGSETRFNV